MARSEPLQSNPLVAPEIRVPQTEQCRNNLAQILWFTYVKASVWAMQLIFFHTPKLYDQLKCHKSMRWLSSCQRKLKFKYQS